MLFLLILYSFYKVDGADSQLIRLESPYLMRHARDIYAGPIDFTCNFYVLDDHGSHVMVNKILYFRALNDYYLKRFHMKGEIDE